MPLMLQDLAGLPPPAPPPPGQSLQDMLAPLLQLGSIDQRHKLLQQQFDQAGHLGQGVPVDYAHGKGTPLLLAGLANLVSSGLGGYQEGKAMGGMKDLVTEQTDARGKLAQALLGAPAPDLSSLMTAPASELPSRAAAAQDALQGQRRGGLAALLSGDPSLSKAGSAVYGDADRGMETMLGMPAQRQQLAGGALDLASKQRGAAVASSPVVAGAGKALLAKLGMSVPDDASAAEIQALVPEAEKAFEAQTKRQEVGKYAVNPTTGRTYDVRTGRDVEGSGGPGSPTSDKRLPKMQTDFGKDMDPNFARAGVLKGNQERSNAADRLLRLAVDPLTGGPANLTPQQMSELSTSLAALLSGGGGSEGQRHELTPYTKGRSLAEITQWLTDKPQGADQRAFVQQMIDTARREQDTVQQQIRGAQAQRLPAHLQYLSLFPDQAKAQLQGYGIDPADVDFKTGRYTPKGNSAQGVGAPQRRTVGGKTYEKRPDGWYEVTDG